MTENNPSQPVEFTQGFALGLLAGVVGFFVFGTKEGKELRTKLVDEWGDAREFLHEQGLLKTPEQLETFSQILRTAKQSLAKTLELDWFEEPNVVKHSGKKRQYRRKSTTQFTGV